MLIDFPVSENKRCQLYKTISGVKARYGTLDESNPAYAIMVELMSCKLNDLTKQYFKANKRFVKLLSEKDDVEHRLLNICPNSVLIDLFTNLL